MRAKINNFDKKTSQALLDAIILNKKINYAKYKLNKFKNRIIKIREEYNTLSSNSINGKPRYWHFWEIISARYSNFDKKLCEKKDTNISKASRCKNNIKRTMYTKYLGFNPTILTLLLYQTEISKLVKSEQYKYFIEFKKSANYWPSSDEEKKLINNCLSNDEINIISTLCPDYDNKKIGKDLYSYTFNKLNDKEGLGALRILENLKKIKDFFIRYNKNITYHIFYGDFESYSDENCKRLNISKEDFLKKLQSSVNLMKSNNFFNKVNCFVNEFLTEREWLNKKEKNKSKIIDKMKKSTKFKNELLSIARSRKMLYNSWFPDLNKDDYYKLVVDQGAEYSTMGDIILEKYPNPLIIGADHPRMKIFYYFNKNIPVIYLNKGY